jgi:hypothetical protein
MHCTALYSHSSYTAEYCIFHDFRFLQRYYSLYVINVDVVRRVLITTRCQERTNIRNVTQITSYLYRNESLTFSGIGGSYS